MSRGLLNFSGGSVDDLRDVLHLSSESELLIASPQRGNELRHGLVPLQSTEAFDGFEDASGDPA